MSNTFTSETDLGPTLDYEAVGEWIEKACKPLGASVYIELWEEILRLNELMGVAQGEHDRLESEVADLHKRLDKCVDKNYKLAQTISEVLG